MCWIVLKWIIDSLIISMGNNFNNWLKDGLTFFHSLQMSSLSWQINTLSVSFCFFLFAAVFFFSLQWLVFRNTFIILCTRKALVLLCIWTLLCCVAVTHLLACCFDYRVALCETKANIHTEQISVTGQYENNCLLEFIFTLSVTNCSFSLLRACLIYPFFSMLALFIFLSLSLLLLPLMPEALAS